MNIFALSYDPQEAAIFHCDKHVVKMIVESAQMLSTVHRLLDGKKTNIEYITKSGKNRKKDVWTNDSELDDKLYLVAHPKHPSTIWTAQTSSNYQWHYQLFCFLCDEYTFRYGKVHATDTKLREILKYCPLNITKGNLTLFALAMKSEPQCMNPLDPVQSYRKFYLTKRNRFKMVWTKREVPFWFLEESSK